MTLPKPGGFLCYDCRGKTPDYMLRDRIWQQAFPNYPEVKRELRQSYPDDKHPLGRDQRQYVCLCFSCIEARLDRPLKPEDFDLNIPINLSIAWALRVEHHPIGDWVYYIKAGVTIDPKWTHPHCEAATQELFDEDPAKLARLVRSGTISPEYLTHVAETLGDWDDWEGLVNTLLPLLDHPKAIVREGAIYGLGKRENRAAKDDRVLAKIEQLKESDPSEAIRFIAKNCLEGWSASIPREILVRTVEDNMARNTYTPPTKPSWYRKPDDAAYLMACSYSAKACLDIVLPDLPKSDAALRVVSYWWDMGYDVLNHPGVKDALEK